VINTGNANAGTGEDGLARARRTCAAGAPAGKCSPEQVLPFSTGVIMEPLPVDRIEAGLPAALAALPRRQLGRRRRRHHDHRHAAQGYSAPGQIGGRTVTLTGISKGAGMIRPTWRPCWASWPPTRCREPACCRRWCARRPTSFNRITIDGDTSTNDSFVLMATQQAGARRVTDLEQRRRPGPARGADRACRAKLAQAIVRDGEGATKFITITVEGGRDEAECKRPLMPSPTRRW
jgi:glutamate N-acetyltransferase/amino-acid N-acetyltransferase